MSEKEYSNFKLKNIYKLIYLNLEDTLHKLNFNIENFSEKWLMNHVECHKLNCHYNNYFVFEINFIINISLYVVITILNIF